MSLNKVSQFFTKALIVILISAFAATPALAASNGKSFSGSTPYSYDYTDGCYRYTGNWTYSWHNVYTNKTGIYDSSETGKYNTYDVCNGNVSVDSGSFKSKWHSVIKDGESVIYEGHATGKYGDVSYRYQMNAVGGKLVKEHYWLNGVLQY